jgi:site-specific DNA-methyltransferase (adenine-specific)
MDVLPKLPAQSVDVCVTSPPYWDLRDYGGKDNTLGLERSPEQYVRDLTDIFTTGVKRVLKPTGALWVNLGDTYRDKQQMQIPARFALAMMDEGWKLRNEIIWHKPNIMPSPAKDRFTLDYEKFFFFTLQDDYYFRQQFEPLAPSSIERVKHGFKSRKFNNGNGIDVPVMGERFANPQGRNMRAVWNIPTSSQKYEHTAMFPTALIETPIKACCPPGGTVLDPFCGSGTVLAYCEQQHIDAIGIEINPAFASIIDQRIERAQ